MREIKFRGKDIHTGLWRYGDLTHTMGIGEDNEHPVVPRVMVGGYEVDPDSVGQYTGLRDINGREIFEHDIIEGPGDKRPYLHAVCYSETDACFKAKLLGTSLICMVRQNWILECGKRVATEDYSEILKGDW